MGEQLVHPAEESHAVFIRHLLDDIKALEFMLDHRQIEEDIYRIGAEQELCLITDHWRPANNADLLMKVIDDPHFASELARYNLEINLDPVELKGHCFTTMEGQIRALLRNVQDIAQQYDTNVLLTGILPTISKNELEMDYMTPNLRYKMLNDMVKELRGCDLQLQLRGVDQLAITHDSVLFEACNTSFQLHLQVPPDDFVASYNWAQAISGPVLGLCTNSPLLLGRELWSETRIALFQQSIDTRTSSYALKDQHARVTYGHEWAEGSISNIYKNDIARHKVLLTKPIDVGALEALKKGKIPKLEALNLHNSTIYRWNRPCYGVKDNKAHLRIENRYIPAGPSIQDEMANFALWAGLMIGRPAKYDNLPAAMDFREAKANFIKAARTGKETILTWNDQQISVRDLITKELLPIAYAGLEKANIDRGDRERLLAIIEERAIGKTGSQWITSNYRLIRKKLKQDDALLALTRSIYEHQQRDLPVHQWGVIEAIPSIHETASQISHIMSTQLFVVNENDLAELATSIMKWKGIHHVPVENKQGELTGLLTWTHMKRYKEREGKDGEEMVVADIMAKQVLTIGPYDDIQTAIHLMKQHEYGCLPVIQNNHLIGIITIKDVIAFDHGLH